MIINLRMLMIALISRLGYTSRLSTVDRDIMVKQGFRGRLGWGGSIWNWVLSIILALAILGAIGMLVYAVTAPQEERFTEFYLLGLGGQAKDYPRLLTLGEEGKVLVAIINKEDEVVTYRVEVTIDGVIDNEVGPLMLEPGEGWEEIVGFTPDKAGDKQKVEFLLYKREQSAPSLRTFILVEVK